MSKFFPDQKLTAILLSPKLLVLVPKPKVCVYETRDGRIDVWENTKQDDKNRSKRIRKMQSMAVYLLWPHEVKASRNVMEQPGGFPLSRLHGGIVLGEGWEVYPGAVLGVLLMAVIGNGEFWYWGLEALEGAGFRVDARAVKAVVERTGHSSRTL